MDNNTFKTNQYFLTFLNLFERHRCSISVTYYKMLGKFLLDIFELCTKNCENRLKLLLDQIINFSCTK